MCGAGPGVSDCRVLWVPELVLAHSWVGPGPRGPGAGACSLVDEAGPGASAGPPGSGLGSGASGGQRVLRKLACWWVGLCLLLASCLV